jgi:hypothetical protein
MSVTGKGSKSIRKLPVAQSLLTNTGFKVTRALHEASEGDTLIQLGSLTTPSTAVNYSAPNPSELTSTNIMAYQDNVRLSSSLRGLLMKNLAWIANGASTIKLLFEAEEAEVFEIIIDHNARTSVQLVDASSQPISGTLAATQSDFNIGVPFEVGKFSAIAQVGVYAIHLDGQLMNRNTGNNPPGPGVTGDYYEVHAGAGLGTLIRFNNVDLINDRAVIAIPVGALVERPNGSQLALIESLQGQIDAIVPTVAALADADETDFQATPNNVDLKAFGDRVLDLEKILDLEIPIQEDWVDAGPIAFSSTGGAVTKGTVITDNLWVRRNGPNLEGRIAYRHSSAGTIAAGDMLITLPQTIDLTKIKAYATVEGSGPWDNDSGVGAGTVTGTAEGSGILSFSVYDNNKLRMFSLSAVNGGAIGSTWFSIVNANVHYVGFFSVPIEGWTATQTVREALGL